MKTFSTVALVLSSSFVLACGAGTTGQTSYDPAPAPAATTPPSETTPTSVSPSITAVQPAFGKSGDTVRVVGHGFGTTPGLVYVGDEHDAVVSWSDTEVTATVPEHTGPGSKSVSVQIPGMASYVAPTTFDVHPQVMSVTLEDPVTIYVHGDDYATAGIAPDSMPVDLIAADGTVVRTITAWFPEMPGGYTDTVAIPTPTDLSGMALKARVVSFGVPSNAVDVPAF